MPARVIDCSPGAPAGDVARHDGDHNPSPDTTASIPPPRDEYSSECKLVSFAETDGRYAALSYCWGDLDYKSYVTTSKNFLARFESIEETELPQIFQDAIRVARNLRVRYLRIDALCIPQDWWKPLEEREAWNHESMNMAGVFSNVVLTICAAAGSEGGLFNEHSNAAFDSPDTLDGAHDHSTSVRLSHSSGKTSTLHFFDSSRSYWRDRKSLQDSRLNKRAWCYQEDLLSPLSRRLAFASQAILLRHPIILAL
jgi:hypothetical protein